MSGKFPDIVGLLRTGQVQAARERYLRLLEQSTAADTTRLGQLGRQLADAGALGFAEGVFQRNCQLQPENAFWWVELATACYFQGKLAPATTALEAARARQPNDLDTLMRLGGLYRDQWRLAEAEATFRQVIALAPRLWAARTSLAETLGCLGRTDDAEATYREAIAGNPADHVAWNNLGLLLRAVPARADESLSCIERSLAICPGYPEALCNLGNALKDQGRLDEAVVAYRASLAGKPDNRIAHSNLLLCLNYCPGLAPAAVFDEHRRFEQQHAARFLGHWPVHDNDRDPQRPLRVGFVSADLRSHAVAQFLLPLLEAHDRRRCHFVCYHCHSIFDATSQRLRDAADDWVDAVALSDPALADRIRADRIDILIDLAGHTASNRLLVFARKPAPVQANWLGYLNTSGLRAIDYHIADAVTCPEGCEPYYSEHSARLPHAPWCYSPPEQAPPLSPLPAQTRGALTLISANAFQKLNHQVLALWAHVLTALPDAHLRFLGVPEARHQRVVATMGQHGIAPDRLELLPRLPLADYYRALTEGDLALDPFPYSGGTSTFDALWAGLPIVTLPGDHEASRSAASILSTLGLCQFIAKSPADYVAIVERTAADLPALASLRGDMRKRMQDTSLADPAQFARAFEVLIHRMWRQHLDGEHRPIG